MRAWGGSGGLHVEQFVNGRDLRVVGQLARPEHGGHGRQHDQQDANHDFCAERLQRLTIDRATDPQRTAVDRAEHGHPDRTLLALLP